MTTPAERKPRLCDVCSGYDTEPRHVSGLAEGAADGRPSDAFIDALPEGIRASAVAELLDPTTYVRHIACCASRGCPTCKASNEAADGKGGSDLLDFILGGGIDHISDCTVGV